MESGDLYRAGSSLRRGNSLTWRNDGSEIFSTSFGHEQNDEEALIWAALEKQPTYDRVRKGVLTTSIGGATEIDVLNLGFQERRNLVERLVKVAEEDNEKFLLKLKKRFDRMTLLLGPPSCGKTTLLLALAGKLDRSLKFSGRVTYNGRDMNEFVPQRTSAYISQHDLHIGEMTVRETLAFSARCQGVGTRYELVAELSRREKAANIKPDPDIDIFMKVFIEEIMELVELNPLRQTIVGLPGLTGLSTEQRKRLTIAVELVANPSIIFMDEPTSGLDARAAAIVIRTVRNTVDTGRTVVCTIHQPSIDIFEAFDEGIRGVRKIEDGYNPATWMLEVTTAAQEMSLGVDFAEIYKSSELYRRNKQLIKELSTPAPGSKDLHFVTQYSQSSLTQCFACLWKQHWSHWRNPPYTGVKFLMTTIVGILLGTITKVQDLFNAMGSMYASVVFLGVQNAASALPVVDVERTVFYRERAAGMYSALPYALAQRMPIWWQWYYWISPIAWSLNGLITSQFGDIKASLENGESVDQFLRGYFEFKHEFLWVVAAVVLGERMESGDLYRAGRSLRRGNSLTCRNDSTEIFSTSFGHEQNDEEALIWAALERQPTYKRLRKGVMTTSIGGAAEIDVFDLGFQERKNLLERLVKVAEEDNEKFLLKLKKRIDRKRGSNVLMLKTGDSGLLNFLHILPNKKVPIHILKDNDFAFGSSKLWKNNPSIGPGRKARSLSKGRVTYNGHGMNEFVPQRTAAYISQHDLHIGEMTVRETLAFSARCQGLLAELSRREKAANIKPDPDIDIYMKVFIEEIMELVELNPLRQAIVGLPGLTGLSTEQRKRLTIAVELVANPSIIFMDEPTSGLDARAAAIVMRTVRNTVDTGRTVVCTIHQPSIDIFEAFDELLLLKRGGQEIYVGPLGRHSCHLIKYFEGIGGVRKIEDGYNPATWMLEVTTTAQEMALGEKQATHQGTEHSCSWFQGPVFCHSILAVLFNSMLGMLMEATLVILAQSIIHCSEISFDNVNRHITGDNVLGSGQTSVQDLLNAMGSMYASVMFLGVQNASAVQPVVAVERAVFYRERAAGMEEMEGGDLYRAGSSLRRGSSLAWRNDNSGIFPTSNFGYEENDEEALMWAALEKQPTYARLRRGVLTTSAGGATEIDVLNLGFQERKNLLDRLGLLNCLHILPNRKIPVHILKDVSGSIKPSRMTLLLGPPSCGKTTLLLALAGKLDSSLKLSGRVTYNGHDMNEFVPQRTAAYISQHDLHIGEMTVRETLAFSARCQGVGTRYELSRREKAANIKPDPDIDIFMKVFVEEIMELVELNPLRQAIVGLPGLTGLSTEQRKRLTIAVELVANPSIIFMDEPTSGLDARAAAIVMRTVRNTVDTGRTVVCTIHQPSIDIFEAFDEGIRGVSKIEDGYNPATWMLEVTTTAQEMALGVDFAEMYKGSELYRRNKQLIKELSTPAPGSKDLERAAGMYSALPYALAQRMPIWWQWYYWICPVAWTLYGLTTSQFGDMKESLETGESVDQFLRSYFGFKHELLWVVAAVVLGFTVLFAFTFAISIKLFNFQKR
ncbi:hypothetical protein Tsubulata_045868 [Turnera subulata]|uniref:ABC transporter domain-containing protein n=1 Tax=Turnera subulata TaxID=218843 RepID=A0A9Q0EZN7_9ROSI|nr:hypothetical protein Tsubulata_045868 [Turnera subulata]